MLAQARLELLGCHRDPHGCPHLLGPRPPAEGAGRIQTRGLPHHVHLELLALLLGLRQRPRKPLGRGGGGVHQHDRVEDAHEARSGAASDEEGRVALRAEVRQGLVGAGEPDEGPRVPDARKLEEHDRLVAHELGPVLHVEGELVLAGDKAESGGKQQRRRDPVVGRQVAVLQVHGDHQEHGQRVVHATQKNEKCQRDWSAPGLDLLREERHGKLFDDIVDVKGDVPKSRHLEHQLTSRARTLPAKSEDGKHHRAHAEVVTAYAEDERERVEQHIRSAGLLWVSKIHHERLLQRLGVWPPRLLLDYLHDLHVCCLQYRGRHRGHRQDNSHASI
mmetsp:Transcript_98843/g.262463  ORF Transcript_98843/g.262463 Transcript_98843/m.262463 type:complete len:333 (+) Transcript_98843:148-1146(+)